VNRPDTGRFVPGHRKVGGFSVGDKHSEQSKTRISESLAGRFGPNSRRWRGLSASYAAKHMWLSKHYSKGDTCEHCGTTKAPRLEWANISGKYLRDRSDYKVLCVLCHRKMDTESDHCRNGHERTESNTRYRSNGWKVCSDCRAVSQRRYMKKKTMGHHLLESQS